MKLKLILFTFFILFFRFEGLQAQTNGSTSSEAQQKDITNKNQDKLIRVEIQARSGSDSYRIIPFGSKGVLLFYESNEYKSKQTKEWFFAFYDVNFEELWNKEFPVKRNMDFKKIDYDDSFLYLLLINNRKRPSENSLQILIVGVDDGTIRTIEDKIPEKVILTEFKVNGNNAFLGGMLKPSVSQRIIQGGLTFTLIPLITGLNVLKYQPAVYTINLKSGNLKILNSNFKGQAYVESIQKESIKNIVNVIIKNYIPKNNNAVYVNAYDNMGNKINTVKLVTSDNTRKINTVKLISLDNNNELAIGTYNNNTKGRSANPVFSGFDEESTGLYITYIKGNHQQYIKFYNFSEFKNFNSYISKARALRIKRRALKKKKRGKELSYNYQLLVHDVIEKDNKYIMIAEAYYPEYHTVTYIDYDYYGRPYTRYYTVFDGYRYTNAIVSCFDIEGNLLWDNSFKIFNIITYDLKERVKVFFDGDDIVLAYSSEGEIDYKILRENEVIESQSHTKIETNYPNDKLISDYNSDMEYWYGDYFISYGYQKIKNRNVGNKRKRTVFYFNKIAFE